MKKSLLAVVVALAAVSTSQAFSFGSDANGKASLQVYLRDKVTVTQKNDTVTTTGVDNLVNLKSLEVKNEVRGRLNASASTKVDGLKLDFYGRLQFDARQSKLRKFDAAYDLLKLASADDAKKAYDALNYTTENKVTRKPELTLLKVKGTTDFGTFEAGYGAYGAGSLDGVGDQGFGPNNDAAANVVTYYSPKFHDLSVGVTAGFNSDNTYNAEGALVYTGLTNNKVELRGGYNFGKKSAWGALQHYGENLGVEGFNVTNLLGGYYSADQQQASYALGLSYSVSKVSLGLSGQVAYVLKTSGVTAKKTFNFATTDESQFDDVVLKKVKEVADFGLTAPDNGGKNTVGYRVAVESKSASQKGLVYDLGAHATATLYQQDGFKVSATLAYTFHGENLTSEATADGLTYTLNSVAKAATDDVAKVTEKKDEDFTKVEVTAQQNGQPAAAEAGKVLVNPVKAQALELKTNKQSHQVYFYLTTTF